MDNYEVLYLVIAIIGCIVGVVGIISGQKKDVSKEAEWKGTINGKLDAILGIDTRVTKLEEKVENHEVKISFLEKSEKRIHERLDAQFGERK